MPRAEERAARDFFVGVLGMTEVDKPPVLAARGGAWFRAGDVELHLGVEDNFRPARKWSFALLLIRQAASASVLSRASVIFAGSRA